MRGEHLFAYCATHSPQGSSPHARGTRFHVREVVEPFGIIPACAGNTWCLVCWCCVGWDHPRMRGEHVRTAWRRLGNRGSSPHARGTPRGRLESRGPVGIIPACAGNTRWASGIPRRCRDHPRMRGEHKFEACVRIGVEGSSPHARGTRPPVRVSIRPLGIIPACAGNTVRWRVRHVGLQDHPRMRGEHFNAVRSATSPQGSSPHARGTPQQRLRVGFGAGIIPACAGNTSRIVRSLLGIWDHPRMRGEHMFDEVSGDRYEGSSPHARGTRLIVPMRGLARGIIPACAGNTWWNAVPAVASRDHPRMRGEHCVPSCACA